MFVPIMKNGIKKYPALSKFLMTLAATTVSIILTFGTTAIVDRKKKNAEKRELVLMIMYDMRESLKEIERCDRDLNAFFDAQVEALAHPAKYQSYYPELAVHIPTLEYSTTAETIFRSNIETIQTIGNILFVETVSSFYDNRDRYKSHVADSFSNEASHAVADYDKLRDFDTASFPFTSQAFLRLMREDFEKCRLMMNVTDKDLDVFSDQQQKILEAVRGEDSYDAEEAIQKWQQQKNRLREALEEGIKNER